MIKKILAFGCSFTFGEHLEGAVNVSDKIRIPSPLAWPQLVADHFGAECVNLARPGASPRTIAWECLLNHDKFSPTTWVVVLWPSYHRHFIPGEHRGPDKTWVPIHREYRKWRKQGYTHDIDRAFDLFTSQSTVYDLVQRRRSLGITEFTSTDAWPRISYISADRPCEQLFGGKNPDYSDFCVDKAADGLHPGPQTQANISEFYIQRIETSLKGPRKIS